MSDTPDRSAEGGVLRPFVEPEQEPPPAAEPLAPPVTVSPSVPPSDTVSEAPSVSDDLIGGSPPESAAPDPAAPDPAAPDPDEAVGAIGLRGADDSPLPVMPDLEGEPRIVTVGRTSFFVGLGILMAAIVGLAALWQAAGGDDGSPTLATDVPVPVDSDGVVIDTSNTDALTAALAEQTDRAEGAERLSIDLEAQISDLEGRLAEQPIPALPASALTRVIVSADAQYLSATDRAVAVIGPFGGYTNIDPDSDTVTASAKIGTEATRVLRTPTTVWATNFRGDELVRFDPITNEVIGRIQFPGPDGLAKHGDTLLVASFSEGFVARVDPADGALIDRVDVGGSATAVTVRDDRIYAAVFGTGEVVKIDSETFEVVDRAIVGAGPVGLLAGTGDRVWITNRSEGTVARVDFETGEIFSIAVGDGPVEVASAFGSLWVAVADAGELVQISFADQAVVTRTPLGGSPTGLSVGAGSLWVAISGDRSVVRVRL